MNQILCMICNVFSGFVMPQFFCVILGLNLCQVIYLGQVRHFLSLILHLKILKPGVDWLQLAVAHVWDELPTSSYPAITALPCRDSASLLGKFPLPSLREATRLGGCPSLALERVTNGTLSNLFFILVLYFLFRDFRDFVNSNCI